MRLGRRDEAIEHVELGELALDAMPDDGYRAMIAAALTRTRASTGDD
jgi:hypothetical protein